MRYSRRRQMRYRQDARVSLGSAELAVQLADRDVGVAPEIIANNISAPHRCAHLDALK